MRLNVEPIIIELEGVIEKTNKCFPLNYEPGTPLYD